MCKSEKNRGGGRGQVGILSLGNPALLVNNVFFIRVRSVEFD